MARGRRMRCGSDVIERCAVVLLAVATAGCVRLPFIKTRHEPPHPPAAVERFASQARQLGGASAPALPEVTRAMADAVEAIVDEPRGRELAQAIRAQASAMEKEGARTSSARAGLDAALAALAQGEEGRGDERDAALSSARRAVEQVVEGRPASVVEAAYREVARAMVRATGGPDEARTGKQESDALQALVARLAVEELDDARRTGALALVALGEAIRRLPSPPEDAGHVAEELRERASRIAGLSPLEYAARWKEALALAASALGAARTPPAAGRLLLSARAAIEAIRADRPFDLQRAVAQDALRLVADAIVVAGAP